LLSSTLIEFDSTLSVQNGAPLVLTSDEIDFLGGASTVSGTGTVLLQPTTNGTSIGVGTGAGTLSLSQTDLAALKDGFTSITIGRAAGTPDIEMAGATFQDPLVVRTFGGTLTVSGTVTGTGNATIDLEGPGGATTLAGDIVTAGQ